MKKVKFIGFLLLTFALAFVGFGLMSAGLDSLSAGMIALSVAPVVAWIKNDQFVELTEEQVAKLAEESVEELAAYYNAKNEHERKELEKLISEKASTEDIDKIRKKIEDNFAHQLKSLNDVLKNQGLLIKEMSKASADEKKMTLSEKIKKGLEDNKDHLKALKDKDTKDFKKFEIPLFDTAQKTAGTMTVTGNVTGDLPIPEYEPGLNVIATRKPWILSLIQRGNTVSDLIRWVEQANKDGGAGGTAEGGAKNKADFDLVVAEASVKKRTVYIKVSNEMLDDIDFMESEIRTELLKLLDLDIDDQLLTGDNLTTNLNGLLTVATAWAAGSFADTVDDANNFDVLMTAIDQIVVAQFMPTAILMHPTDVTSMHLTKDSTGQYVFPYSRNGDGTEIIGIPIYMNTGMTIDNFLVMDGSKAKAFFRKNATISMGYENDDFTKNLVTILAEARLVQRVKGNDTGAFVTGDFTTAKAALETP